MIIRLLFVVTLAMAATINTGNLALAQAQNQNGVMTMTGVGQVDVTPDIASISLGVEVKSPTADRALRAISVRVGEILQVLSERGILEKDVQTTQISLYPQWTNQSRSFDQPLKITGFLATNLLTIKVRDLDFLGPTLDALTKSGANRIDNIRLDISTPDAAINKARALAMEDAFQKARLYATAANVQLGPILAISESPARPIGTRQFEATALSRETLPIAAGELTVRAEITVQFRIISP